jgi:hypothetical protein
MLAFILPASLKSGRTNQDELPRYAAGFRRGKLQYGPVVAQRGISSRPLRPFFATSRLKSVAFPPKATAFNRKVREEKAAEYAKKFKQSHYRWPRSGIVACVPGQGQGAPLISI